MLKFKLALLALMTALFVSGGSAQAQDGGGKLGNTAWVGMETVTGSPSKLGLTFRADGTCIMVDAVSPGEVKGNWRQEGDQVTIQFSNCVYRGRVAGNRLVGTASGLDGGASWSFEVMFAPPMPRR